MDGKRFRSSAVAVALFGILTAMPITAVAGDTYERVYDARAQKHVYVPKRTIGDRLKNAWRNPMVRKGTIGAGIGLGTAAVTDAGLLKGGLIGAGVGVGFGAMDKSATMQRKPLLRHVSKGALAGAGVGAAAGGIGALPAAVVGAGAGALTHYIKKD